MTCASPACSGRRRPSGTSSGSDHGPAHTTATSASIRRRRVKARTPSPCGESATHFSFSCTTAPAATASSHLHLDRAAREDHGAVGLEDRRRVGLRAHLGEQPRHVAVVELVVAHARLAQRRGHRRDDRAALEQAVAAQERHAAAALEVVPELERPHRQAHVVGVRVREAEGARVVARAAEVVADRVLLDQGHGPAALGERARRGGAHGAGTDDDGGLHRSAWPERGDGVHEVRMDGLGDVDRPGMRARPARVDDDALALGVRVPGLHRGALVGRREGGEHGVAGVDVGQVAEHDLLLVALGAPAEIAAHGIDRLPAERAHELIGAAAVLLGEGRAGEVDATRHRHTLRPVEGSSSPPQFESLGHAGKQNYAGLETFPNPGVERVEMTSDELAALCPITLQPDMYVATIEYFPAGATASSRSR